MLNGRESQVHLDEGSPGTAASEWLTDADRLLQVREEEVGFHFNLLKRQFLLFVPIILIINSSWFVSEKDQMTDLVNIMSRSFYQKDKNPSAW